MIVEAIVRLLVGDNAIKLVLVDAVIVVGKPAS